MKGYKRKRFTVPTPYRKIVRKNERQHGKVYDVLICGHAAPVDASTKANTYRVCRGCEVCRRRVQLHEDARKRGTPIVSSEPARVLQLRRPT